MFASSSLDSSPGAAFESEVLDRHVNASHHDPLAEIRTSQNVKANKTIFLEGDDADNVYVVREGVLRIFKIFRNKK